MNLNLVLTEYTLNQRSGQITGYRSDVVCSVPVFSPYDEFFSNEGTFNIDDVSCIRYFMLFVKETSGLAPEKAIYLAFSERSESRHWHWEVKET